MKIEDIKCVLSGAFTKQEIIAAVYTLCEYVSDLECRLEKAERKIEELESKPVHIDHIETFNA